MTSKMNASSFQLCTTDLSLVAHALSTATVAMPPVPCQNSNGNPMAPSLSVTLLGGLECLEYLGKTT